MAVRSLNLSFADHIPVFLKNLETIHLQGGYMSLLDHPCALRDSTPSGCSRLGMLYDLDVAEWMDHMTIPGLH